MATSRDQAPGAGPPPDQGARGGSDVGPRNVLRDRQTPDLLKHGYYHAPLFGNV